MHVKLKSLSPCRDGMKQAAKRSQASQMYKIQWKKNIFTHIHFLVLLFGIMRIIRLWHLLDCDLWPFSVLWFEVHEDLQNCLRPVWAVGEQTQIRQRLLRSARLPFHLRELITSQPNIQDSSLEQLCLHYPRIILRWQAIILHAL